MKNFTRFTSIAIAFCLLISSAVFAQAQKKPKPEKNKFLETKTYESSFTEVKEKGKPGKPLKGDVVIKSGKVSCTVMEEKTGFAACNYHVTSDTTEGDKHVVVFEATFTEGKSESKMEATVTNSEIAGTVVESKDGKEKKKYEFTGTEKEKPGKKK